jgi:FMN phosphatase YigB (HAD superfamily)
MKGWYFQAYRHSLAARGIKTKTPVMHTDRMKFLRYEPKEMDKVIFVDLDDTLADVETENDLKQTLGFDLITEMGVDEFRKAGVEGRLVGVDNYEATIAAYNKWKAGEVPHFNLGDVRGNFYVFERPGMVDKLKQLSKNNRLVLYTAAGPVYAKAVLNTLGIGDLFQDMISNQELELFKMNDTKLPFKEGLKPISPAARHIGLEKGDVILVDDREDFAGGPEARAQWVKSPTSDFPTESSMKDFFKKLDKKVKELNKGKFVDEHTALASPDAHLSEETKNQLRYEKMLKERGYQEYPEGFTSLNPSSPVYEQKYVSGPWDYEDDVTKEYYRKLFSKGGDAE